EDREGAHDVGVDEGPRVVQGVVVVGLGREVDDDVGLGHERVDDVAVGDVALDELDVQPGQGLAAARVGELVEDGDLHVGTLGQGLADEVGTDEPGTTGHEHAHGTTPWSVGRSGSAHAVVGPAGGAPLGGVQDVAAVDDGRPVGEVLDGGGVEVAELAPLGEEQDDVGAGDGVLGGVGDGEAVVVLGGEDGTGLGVGDGDVGAGSGEAVGDVQGR